MKTIYHAEDLEGCFSICGRDIDGTFTVSTEVRVDVTCKRCLASLAKRDREFQRKAQRGIARAHTPARALAAYLFRGHSYAQPGDAVRAIAREEGRDAIREFGRANGLCS